MSQKHPATIQDHQRHPTFLRAWRDFRELSQEEVAFRLEINRATLSKIENGKLPYNQDFLERVALIYRCEPEDLISINPKQIDPPKLVYDQLRSASPELQRRAMTILEAILKAG